MKKLTGLLLALVIAVPFPPVYAGMISTPSVVPDTDQPSIVRVSTGTPSAAQRLSASRRSTRSSGFTSFNTFNVATPDAGDKNAPTDPATLFGWMAQLWKDRK